MDQDNVRIVTRGAESSYNGLVRLTCRNSDAREAVHLVIRPAYMNH